MKKNLFTSLLLFMISFTISSQNNNFEYGIKGGLNYSKHTDGYPVYDFEGILGYYGGVYGNISLKNNFKLQAEILFARQGTKFSLDYIGIILPQTPGSGDDDFYYEPKGEIKEFTIIVPVLAQYYISKKFYVEVGPQLGFIIDQKVELYEADSQSKSSSNYDKVDFGISSGAGFMLTEKLGLSARYFFGVIKRDGDIKSSVFNVGINYAFGK